MLPQHGQLVLEPPYLGGAHACTHALRGDVIPRLRFEALDRRLALAQGRRVDAAQHAGGHLGIARARLLVALQMLDRRGWEPAGGRAVAAQPHHLTHLGLQSSHLALERLRARALELQRLVERRELRLHRRDGRRSRGGRLSGEGCAAGGGIVRCGAAAWRARGLTTPVAAPLLQSTAALLVAFQHVLTECLRRAEGLARGGVDVDRGGGASAQRELRWRPQRSAAAQPLSAHLLQLL